MNTVIRPYFTQYTAPNFSGTKEDAAILKSLKEKTPEVVAKEHGITPAQVDDAARRAREQKERLKDTK